VTGDLGLTLGVLQMVSQVWRAADVPEAVTFFRCAAAASTCPRANRAEVKPGLRCAVRRAACVRAGFIVQRICCAAAHPSADAALSNPALRQGAQMRRSGARHAGQVPLSRWHHYRSQHRRCRLTARAVRSVPNVSAVAGTRPGPGDQIEYERVRVRLVTFGAARMAIGPARVAREASQSCGEPGGYPRRASGSGVAI